MPISEERPSLSSTLRYGNEGLDVSLADDFKTLNAQLNQPEIQGAELVGLLELVDKQYGPKQPNNTWQDYLGRLQSTDPTHYRRFCITLCQRKDLIDIPLSNDGESLDDYRVRLVGYQPQAEKWVAKYGSR